MPKPALIETASLEGLQQQLGVELSTQALLRQALTHRSFGSTNNERLEFLGDAVLNAVVGHLLFVALPDLPEGDLSRVRTHLVRQDALHNIAKKLKLSALMRLGEGELRSGGAERASILADAVEALIGAVYLDRGFDNAKKMVEGLFADVSFDPKLGGLGKDAKTELQEWLQARKAPVPSYTVLRTLGAAHVQTFEVQCEVPSLKLRASAQGLSRRSAEQAAAAMVLERIRVAP